MVDRYDNRPLKAAGGCFMAQDQKGLWVKHSDYKALEKERDRFRDALIEIDMRCTNLGNACAIAHEALKAEKAE